MLFRKNSIIEIIKISGKYKLTNEFGLKLNPNFSISTRRIAAKISANLFTKSIKYFSCTSSKLKNWPIFIFLDARLKTNQFEITKVEAIIKAYSENKVLYSPNIGINFRPSKIIKNPKRGKTK